MELHLMPGTWVPLLRVVPHGFWPPYPGPRDMTPHHELGVFRTPVFDRLACVRCSVRGPWS